MEDIFPTIEGSARRDYLLEEIRVYREHFNGRRLRFTDAQRRRLGVKAKALRRKTLEQFAGIVTPDTLLRWFRNLVAKKYDGSSKRGPGRPRIRQMLRCSGTIPIRLPARSPDLNAFAERFVLSIKSECVNRIIRTW